MRRTFHACLTVWFLIGAAAAAESPVVAPERRFHEVFPGATSFGPIEGTPPAAAAYEQDRLAGYVFATRQVIQSSGFSGKPLNVLAGVDTAGRLTGAVLLEHQEPILIIGVADSDLEAFVAQYQGLDIREPVRVVRHGRATDGAVDAVAGATISSVVINDGILRAARAVARSRGLLGGASAGLDLESFAPADWRDLLAEGALVRRSVTVGEAQEAVASQGGRLFPQALAPPPPDASFLELTLGLASPPRVGRNLLGERLYNRTLAELKEGDQLLFLAGQGLYSFKGTAYVRQGVFDRLQLVQGELTLRFRKEDHIRVQALAPADAPELREMALFVIRGDSGFEPAAPWRLDLLVAPEGEGPPAVFTVNYRLPESFLRRAAASAPEADTPLWQDIWWDRRFDIAVLALGLVVLTGFLVFQDSLTRRPRFYRVLRTGFLVFTLFWLGWYAGAQLSVINVLTFAGVVLSEFHWDFFLLEPLMFVLWSFVAVAMLFLGRGVFCGWLCPFGALQELLNRVAVRIGLPQWRLPFALHERLWPIKYIIFLALFALFLGDLSLALLGAEVEPFKTAIVLTFDRSWPFVLYALGLLAAGLFVNRAFCRYLCPLGAALAIPARLRMFDWLKRRWQCGNPCHECALSCPVQAIHPEGQINPNECIHCLRCQVNYHDAYLCPPLIDRRKRQERRTIARARRAQTVEDGG